MRYLLNAAWCGVLAVTACPAPAAVVMDAPAVVVPLSGEMEATAAADELIRLADAEARTGAKPVGALTPDDTAELPEPATWAMLFLGLFGLSFALRRRDHAGTRIRFA